MFSPPISPQVLAYALCGLSALFMTADSPLGMRVTLVCGMLSRAALAAANSAMWVAAPEMYPTAIRGVGANTAFLFNVLGSVPASYFVYSDLPRGMVAAGVCAANLLAAALAFALPETAGAALDAPLPAGGGS